jgi:hypothetical protein
MFGLPFSGEAKNMEMVNLKDILEAEKAEEEENENEKEEEKCTFDAKVRASDDLVQSLMLPDDAICNERIPSPFLRSFHQTILKRAMNRNPSKDDLVFAREFGPNDPMATPPDILESARPALEAFRQAFPLKKKKKQKANKRGRGRSAATHTDLLPKNDDEE